VWRRGGRGTFGWAGSGGCSQVTALVAPCRA
jgi:hypothetical protein